MNEETQSATGANTAPETQTTPEPNAATEVSSAPELGAASVTASTPEPSTAAEISSTPEPSVAAETQSMQPVVQEAPTATEQTETVSTDPGQASKESKSKKNIVILVILLVVMAAISIVAVILLNPFGSGEPDTPMNAQSDSDDDKDPLGKASMRLSGNSLADFDLSLLKAQSEDSNIIYSPLSIKYALAMLADGSSGESKEQITNIIGDYKPKAYLNSANRSIANAMMVRDSFADHIKSSYTDLIGEKYNASLILDSFTTPDNANKWVSDKTLGIINNLLSEDDMDEDTIFLLINALSIDMKWENQIQCSPSYPANETTVPCKNNRGLLVVYPHESHGHYVGVVDGSFGKILFDGSEEIEAGEIGADANRYDIISELGEDYIRETVLNKYQEWVAENGEEQHFNIETYMSDLASNYGKNDSSTDFYFYDDDEVKVFAKDLQEYDGETLQYVGIMPKTSSLKNYVKDMTAEKVSSLINSMKNAADINSYKEGVVTSVTGHIPFFKYNYRADNLIDELKALGITDVFDLNKADLSEIVQVPDNQQDKPFINTAIHVADIDFSNDGITAAAATALGGGIGSAASFDYKWDVPVEEIDITFDKPFMYLIRDKKSGEVWFAGAFYRKGE